jgi:hypothetical protein
MILEREEILRIVRGEIMSRAKLRKYKSLAKEGLNLIERMQKENEVLEENLKMAFELRECREEIENLKAEVIFHSKATVKAESKVKFTQNTRDILINSVNVSEKERNKLINKITDIISRNEKKFFKGSMVSELKETIKNY